MIISASCCKRKPLSPFNPEIHKNANKQTNKEKKSPAETQKTKVIAAHKQNFMNGRANEKQKTPYARLGSKKNYKKPPNPNPKDPIHKILGTQFLSLYEKCMFFHSPKGKSCSTQVLVEHNSDTDICKATLLSSLTLRGGTKCHHML